MLVQADVVTLTVTGDIDLANVGEFRDALAKAVAEGGQSVVDFSACRYIDSAGVAALFKCHAATPVHGVVVPSKAPIQRIFELLGIARRIPIYETIEAALAKKIQEAS